GRGGGGATAAASRAAAGGGHEGIGGHAGIADGFADGAGSAPGAVVLPVAIEPIRHAVVAGDVIHLAVGGRNRKHLAGAGRDAGAAVLGEGVAAGDLGIHPDVVAIAATGLARAIAAEAAAAAEEVAAVEGTVEAAARDQHLVGILRVHRHAEVVAGAADEGAVPTGDLPTGAAVVGAPERTLIGGLHERVHALPVGRRDRDFDLADGSMGQALGKARPREAAIVGGIDAAAAAAAELGPGVLLDRPHAGQHGVGMLGIEGQAGATGPRIHVQHALPVGAAVVGAVDALLALAGEVAFGADPHDVRVGGVHQDASDAAAIFQAHVLPRRAGIGGFVHAVAFDIAGADDPGLAGADPDGVGIGGGQGERADGGNILVVKD